MWLGIKDWLCLLFILALGFALINCRVHLHDSISKSKLLHDEVIALQAESNELGNEVTALERTSAELKREILDLKKENTKIDRERSIVDLFACRGRALLRLERVAEAAASFEVVVQNQPKNVLFIEKLIDCHRQLENNNQIKILEAKLAAVVDEFSSIR